MNQKKYKSDIMELLIKNRGKYMTARDISKELNISYPTALKWLDVLCAEGKIEMCIFGNVKVFRYV